MAFKLGKSSAAKFAKIVTDDVMKTAETRLPLIGRLPVGQRLNVLGAAAAICLLIAGTAVFINNRDSGHSARYAAESSKLLVSLHELTRDVQRSLGGDSASFDNLGRLRQEIPRIISLLDEGDGSLPPTSGSSRGALQTLMVSLNQQMEDVKTLEAGRSGLVTLYSAISVIEAAGDELRRLTQHMIDNFGGAQKVSAIRLALAVERVAKDATRMAASDVSMEQLAQLGIDTLAAEEALNSLPQDDPNVRAATKLFEPYRTSVEILVSQSRNLVGAKEAARSINANSNILLDKTQLLMSSYQTTLTSRITGAVAPLAAGLTLLMLLLLSKEYIAESRRRAIEAERTNRQNQQAILRLMNELSDLADGDLTVRATVSEDITGAIADSVNYTTDELRKLVAGVSNASEEVARATSEAGAVTKELLGAAQKQADEIRDAGGAVELMSKSIQEVDSSAAQSSEVARRTLEVTERGAQAVRNSVTGMDGIREQIQDTSKRIKRLGESSQEIGEIVDLISDITEQTNVLALNAAIQAASAGEAGRGFAVVAEEVQRLAERSAEATKQIGTLVKTIQSDTQDAVAAMEKSTQGVVDGAKLSDAAGQALREIEQSTRELTDLVNSISVSTQVQTDMAREVTSVMEDILKITEQTSQSTQRTNTSVNQLETLASELSSSVAGFKL